ncbi:hypothetical protein PanWU01x14_110230 [Parasponia andersonii]|uniref:Uncharacterized protein n=1 Tax=Parasponia andersonii TaxID=3476 RepID=A0A2P5CZA4_PARAD|nr:hypothetical protein PanWU01x14_110230 [Parasponia andersonii]
MAVLKLFTTTPLQLHKSIFDAAKEVLDLPKETKMQKTSDRPGALSYVAPNPAVPLYENIAIYNPTTLEGAESFTNIMWPQGNHNFRYVQFDWAFEGTNRIQIEIMDHPVISYI